MVDKRVERSRLLRLTIAFGGMAVVANLTGCVSHPVTFQDASYSTGARHHAATVVAVIDQQTLTQKVRVKSWMTGIAHNWEAEPGDMLKQVADIELPQMFSAYEFSVRDRAPPGTGPGIVLALIVPSYDFADFRAKVVVHANAKARNGALLFEKSYRADGASQGGKMFWAGAFGMKSAIRQSSLDAYKQIFAQMRVDLERGLIDQQLTATR
jgi:hypothetical protein